MNTDTTNESLEDAAKRIFQVSETVGYNHIQSNRKKQNAKREAFKDGAKWQKEKDKAIIDKLTAFVEQMAKRYENSEWIGGEGRKLLNQIKQAEGK